VNPKRPAAAHLGVPPEQVRRPGRGPVFRLAAGEPVAASCGCQGVVHATSGLAGPHPSVAVLVTAPCPTGHPDRLADGVIEHFVPAGPNTVAPVAVLGSGVEAPRPANTGPDDPPPDPRRRRAGGAGARGRRGAGTTRTSVGPTPEPARPTEDRRAHSPAQAGLW
jgi:hypothetical protein